MVNRGDVSARATLQRYRSGKAARSPARSSVALALGETDRFVDVQFSVRGLHARHLHKVAEKCVFDIQKKTVYSKILF